MFLVGLLGNYNHKLRIILQSSLENEEYEAAAGFVEALLHLRGNDTDGSIAKEKQHAHFNHTREAVASVIRDKISSAAATDNAEQVRKTF